MTTGDHVIYGENVRTQQIYLKEFGSAQEARTAFQQMPGLIQEYYGSDELAALQWFIQKNYVLESRASLRQLIRKLRRRLGIASREDRLWMNTWARLGEIRDSPILNQPDA
ncbi:MAG TPA: hypothetical protein VNL15_00630 [Dehalococcoidia bacterium]|nr:hypothetical protein [Dehalococcoidia bacterium]